MLRNQKPVTLSSWSAVRRDGCVLASLLTLALWVLPARAEPMVHEAGKIRESKATLDSGGKPIKVYRFEPATVGKCPAIVLLHGADGPWRNKELYHTAARRLAVRGYWVLLVHYFDRTGDRAQDAAEVADQFKKCLAGTATKEQATVSRARFREWMTTVRDAVVYARTLPGVDKERVGLVGFSLGAYLALSVASDEGLRIAAVVEFFGGLLLEAKEGLKNLPPVLGFHGDKDQTVPVKEAEDLRDLLANRRLPGEVQIYKGVGHVFQKDGRLQLKAVLDAESRTIAFLGKHLKHGAMPEPGKEPPAGTGPEVRRTPSRP
jgi:carboxymethylenebutenolidase